MFLLVFLISAYGDFTDSVRQKTSVKMLLYKTFPCRAGILRGSDAVIRSLACETLMLSEKTVISL